MSVRDKLLKRVPRDRIVKTPDGSVRVTGMSLACKDQCQGRAALGEPWRAYAVVHCTYDSKTGEPLFTSDDLDALAKLDVTVFEPIVDAIVELSALSVEEQEELEGN